MEMIETLLREHGAELVEKLTGAGDLDAAQAERFIPEAGRDVAAALGSGGLDLGSLLGGDLGSLLSKIDLGALAGRSGVSESQASGALGTLLPLLLRLFQGEKGGLEGLVSAMGGEGWDDMLSKAGQLFGN